MGLLISHLWQRLFSSTRDYKIVLMGLDNVGKTTILYQLHLGELVETQPTIGCNVESVKHKNLHFQCWDCSGQESSRELWQVYLNGAAACILVVDSTDRDRMSMVKEELWKLLANEDLSSTVILVFANKQELSNAISPADIAESLNLQGIKSHSWNIQPCCALTGDGLNEGIDWITQKILEKS